MTNKKQPRSSVSPSPKKPRQSSKPCTQSLGDLLRDAGITKSTKGTK